MTTATASSRERPLSGLALEPDPTGDVGAFVEVIDRSEAVEAGPHGSSNRYPQTSNASLVSAGPVSAVETAGRPVVNLDHLSLTWCIQWSSDHWDQLRQQLREAKDQAGIEGLQGPGPARIDLGESTWFVNPRAGHLGDAQRGRRMDWVLDREGVTLQLRDQRDAEPLQPNAQLIIPGMACLLQGTWACLSEVRLLIEVLGGSIRREAISRLDLCVDLPDVSVEPLAEAFQLEHVVSRARQRGWDQSNGQSFYLGGTEKRLKIYDKLAEVQARWKPLKYEAMVKNRWGGVRPRAATRVEYQLRSPTLREQGITSTSDYRRSRAALIDHLLGWSRLTDGAPNRENTARAKLHPVWLVVDQALRAYLVDHVKEAPPPPLTRRSLDVSAYVRQFVGTFMNAAALMGLTPESSPDELETLLVSLSRKELQVYPWRAKLAEKQRKLMRAA